MFWFLCLLLVTSPALGGYLTNNGWDCGDGEILVDEFICDGHNQCDDNSDEGTRKGEGCNLYPDSGGCKSYQGIRRWRCERTGQCFVKNTEAEACESSDEEPGRECNVTRIDGQEVRGWRCRDMDQCVERDKVG